MSASKLAMIVGLSIVVIVGGSLLGWVSMFNSEIRLRHQVEAKQEVLKSHHDKMWKILKQNADVSDEYRETFEKIYPKLISGRYNTEQTANLLNIKMVQEDNPDFDTTLYSNLQRTIEAERASFHRTQSELIDIRREHEDLVTTFPGVLLGRDSIEITTVTSSRTEEVFDKGQDDNTNLFD